MPRSRRECERRALDEKLEHIARATRACTRTCVEILFISIHCFDDDTFRELSKEIDERYKRALADCAG
jgi:hypothetical protein